MRAIEVAKTVVESVASHSKSLVCCGEVDLEAAGVDIDDSAAELGGCGLG